MKKISALVAAAAFASMACAQESVTFTNVNSDLPGTVLNYTFSNSFNWFGSLSVSGTLREVNGNTFASEARIGITTQANGGVVPNNLQVFTQGNFTGSVTGSRNFTTSLGSGGFVNPQGQTWAFNFFESFNDPGIDARWETVTLTFNAAVRPACIDLGGIDGTIQLNTLGTTLAPNNDTEIALYSNSGIKLFENDDFGGGLLSAINAGELPDGVYYVAVAGFNTVFGNGWATTSTSPHAGNAVLNVTNGTDTLTGSGNLAAAGVNWYCFTVPTPGALAIVGMGGLVAIRRRRA